MIIARGIDWDDTYDVTTKSTTLEQITYFDLILVMKLKLLSLPDQLLPGLDSDLSWRDENHHSHKFQFGTRCSISPSRQCAD